MISEATLSAMMTLPIGGGIILLCLKFLIPWLKSSTNTFVAQNSASTDILTKAIDERDKALLRADDADKRAERYFTELAEMKTQVQLLTWQLKQAEEKIDLVTSKLDKMMRGASA